MIFIQEDKQFTNKEELEYPTEDDFVDVKVLNNNTKILSEKKADIDSLLDVARESEPKAIENAVKNIKNDVSQNLQGVAKERSTYSIENKVTELERKIQYLEDKEKRKNWASLPNIKFLDLYAMKFSDFSNSKELLNITGSGDLIMVMLDLNSNTGKVDFKIEIDGEPIYDVNINLTGAKTPVRLGLLNENCNNNVAVLGDELRPRVQLLNTSTRYFNLQTYLLKQQCRWTTLSKQKKYLRVSDFHYLNQGIAPATVLLETPIKFTKNLKISIADNNTVTDSSNFYICGI